ncbi:phytoene desaturase family protein [Sphingorhabdus sp.]|jgi:phytoene dehydrogenase-like protein|uniref:phytoene desaturase family protein n=1 Tax=Sphingorhabdus sp. TaxID=1902408 RepID=UPI003D81C414
MNYDDVIIGGGHNGLVCAFYLAQAGRRVRVLERRHIVGGAAVTEEFHPGFRTSIASYTVSLLSPDVIRDMRLTERGLCIVERPFAGFVPYSDDRYLVLGGDPEKAQAQVRKFSEKDAEALPEYENMLSEVADVLRDIANKTPPNSGGGLRALLATAAQGYNLARLPVETQRNVLDLFTKSARSVLDSWFESDQVKGALGFDSVIGFYGSPDTPGSAYVLLHHFFGEVNGKRGAWGHAIGGMGAITAKMAQACVDVGVEISLNSPVCKVLVDNKRVSGVALESGEVVLGRTVVANVGPKLLYERLIEPQALSKPFRRAMSGFQTGCGSFRMNVALKELPQFTCLPGDGDHHRAAVFIAPSLDYMDRAYRDAREFGWSREPVIDMMLPSAVDPSLAPAGSHVAAIFCQQFASHLPDGRSWDDAREDAADTVIETINRYAPNFRDSIIARQILSPLDLERIFGLVDGDIMHGAMSLDQLWAARPLLGHADYRGPIRNLFMCGAGTHPGGGVTGLPGRNAAREVVRGW